MTYGFLEHLQGYFSFLPPSYSIFSSFLHSQLVKVLSYCFSNFPFHHSNMSSYSPLQSPLSWSLLAFLILNVTLGYIITSKYLELGTTNKRGMLCLSFYVSAVSVNIICSTSIILLANFMIFFSLQLNSTLQCICNPFSLSIHRLKKIQLVYTSQPL